MLTGEKPAKYITHVNSTFPKEKARKGADLGDSENGRGQVNCGS